MTVRGYDWVRAFIGKFKMVLETVSSTLAQNAALIPGETVIVAVSGGCDSVALLHLLRRWGESIDINLHVASLNHGIRGAAGQQDLDFVAELASRWRLPHSLGRADVPSLAREWGVGIEAAARRARYDFLARVAGEQGSSCVTVGHHALDQAETIIMNIVRGSGSAGLRGMKVLSPLPGHPGLRLVRPLLQLSKDDLESYCRDHNLPFRVDGSNDDIGYRRNFVRHELIGRMRRLNPALLSAMGRLAESAAVEEDFLSSSFESIVTPLLTVSPERWRIPTEDFAALHPALQRRFLREAYRHLSGESARLSHALTLDLIAWSQKAATGARRDLSAAVRMRRSYDVLCIERTGAPAAREGYRLISADTDREILLDTPVIYPKLRLCLSRGLPASSAGQSLSLPASLELRLRTRRPGDRFKPQGMGGQSRKLKDWMIDRKIPRELRDQIPLICANGDIVAICLGDEWRLADCQHFEGRDADCLVLTLA